MKFLFAVLASACSRKTEAYLIIHFLEDQKQRTGTNFAPKSFKFSATRQKNDDENDKKSLFSSRDFSIETRKTTRQTYTKNLNEKLLLSPESRKKNFSLHLIKQKFLLHRVSVSDFDLKFMSLSVIFYLDWLSTNFFTNCQECVKTVSLVNVLR